MTALLHVTGLRAGYGPVQVLHGIDFVVNEGEVVVILGANGSGKTTTLRAVSGMIGCRGTVQFRGKPLSSMKPEEITRAGIAHVPQGRGTLAELTVEENLRIGAFTRRDKASIQDDIERWYDVFPRLRDRRGQQAGNMSGGEQQMLAISRALMSRPKLLLLDEPSLGLAPLVTQGLFRVLRELNRDNATSMLVVEQNAQLALDIAHRGYVLEAGSLVVSGAASELSANDEVRRAYLGI